MGKHSTEEHVRHDEADDSSGVLELEDAAPGHPDAAPRRGRRALIVVGAVFLVLLLLVAGGAWWVTERYAGNVDRLGDVFEDIPDDARPAPATPTAEGVDGDPVTFLLIGSDTRQATADGDAPGARSDAIMIARIGADREHAQLISIPRDSWVEIPGHGLNKVNASYAFGGPGLLIQTVEQLTGVRIDHFVAIDFEGLAEVTDALGGVDVVVAETTTNGGYTFEAGPNHITGEEVRWYLGQRYGLPGGDFDRVRRQQQFLKAVMDKLISRDTFGDLGRLDASLRALGNSVAVDSGLGDTAILSLAYSLRNLDRSGVEYFTAPVLGTGREGAASVVYLDENAGQRMWEYLRTDSLGENAGEFADQALPDVPRWPAAGQPPRPPDDAAPIRVAGRAGARRRRGRPPGTPPRPGPPPLPRRTSPWPPTCC
jgi:LCP family protein required for cell wall assembly